MQRLSTTFFPVCTMDCSVLYISCQIRLYSTLQPHFCLPPLKPNHFQPRIDNTPTISVIRVIKTTCTTGQGRAVLRIPTRETPRIAFSHPLHKPQRVRPNSDGIRNATAALQTVHQSIGNPKSLSQPVLPARDPSWLSAKPFSQSRRGSACFANLD
ncbi:uncharacterized protein BP01DRAFT_128684 [Aspergillus saccharolyticus JOP 1030-1]|uniref:Uncharacterized protein n=1 Tax=Aspergillus saccharolyticus JOP 1030-1 TaxID=1450539 RepID=A0A318ZGJ4_9EURO|nr:hypothetical protein BP01DRAFT_128684 [Aspergillus saccharolyticus JOP 1030-1]PYH42760.1 hypothetical protein BP01DRAFT_128684 [Aspergillus saccharolyticus JOP 1030-1]